MFFLQLLVALVGSSSSTCSGSGCTEDGLPIVSLLQSAVRIKEKDRAEQTPAAAEAFELLEKRMCDADRSADLDRPAQQVIDEHPNFDGFCYFWSHVSWFHGTPTIHLTKNYTMGDETLQTFGNFLGHNKGPLVTYDFDAAPKGLSSHLDAPNYVYDDPYCFSLGFLKNQGLNGSLMSDYEAWKAIGQEECQKIQAEYDFSDEEMTVAHHVNYNPTIAEKSACAAGQGPKGCTPVTIREYKKHAYFKCLMGDESPEMSYCYARGCLLPGNFIGHGPDCKD